MSAVGAVDKPVCSLNIVHIITSDSLLATAKRQAQCSLDPVPTFTGSLLAVEVKPTA